MVSRVVKQYGGQGGQIIWWLRWSKNILFTKQHHNSSCWKVQVHTLPATLGSCLQGATDGEHKSKRLMALPPRVVLRLLHPSFTTDCLQNHLFPCDQGDDDDCGCDESRKHKSRARSGAFSRHKNQDDWHLHDQGGRPLWPSLSTRLRSLRDLPALPLRQTSSMSSLSSQSSSSSLSGSKA